MTMMKKLCTCALAAALLLSAAACGTPSAIPNPPLVLGEKYLADLDYEQALLQFDQAIVIEPKNPRGYLGKADALLHLERQSDAAEALAAAEKQCRPQRAALKEAKAAMGKSLVEAYIALATAYETLGWRDLALALLVRVCEELPEESRLREALERLIDVIENASNAAQQGNEMTAAPVVLPDNVFGMKDVLECGITLGSDIYAIAEKIGISRDRVFSADHVFSAPDLENPYVILCDGNFGRGDIILPIDDEGWESGKYPVPIGMIIAEEGRAEISCDYSYYSNNYIMYNPKNPKLVNYQLVRGIGFGMRGEDVLRKFYYTDGAVIIENGEPKGKNTNVSPEGESLAELYSFSNGERIGYLGGYNNENSNSTYCDYFLSYGFTDYSADMYYQVNYTIKDGIVNGIGWWTTALG